MTCRLRSLLPALILLAVLAGAAQAAETLSLQDLVSGAAAAQHRGGWFRDRCQYFQKIYIERYRERSEDGAFQKLFYRRVSVAEVSADQTGEVVARLVSDTDGDLKPKEVKASSRNVFGAPAFLELIFFPFYPENIPFLECTDLGPMNEGGRSLRMVGFKVKPDARYGAKGKNKFVNYPRQNPSDPEQPVKLVEGVLFLDAATGAPVKLTISGLFQFEALDSHLKKLTDFQCSLEYRTLPNGVTVPHHAQGAFRSDVPRYDGYIRFTFDEWGYRPNPLYAKDVQVWFEKMKDVQDDAPPVETPGAPVGGLAAHGAESATGAQPAAGETAQPPAADSGKTGENPQTQPAADPKKDPTSPAADPKKAPTEPTTDPQAPAPDGQAPRPQPPIEPQDLPDTPAPRPPDTPGSFLPGGGSC